jgi:very-short-patch-repair endonuclease
MLPLEHHLEFMVPFQDTSTYPKVAFLDIAFTEMKLAVEVDGGVHRNPKKIPVDALRTQKLTSQGWTVIRFWNSEVTNDTSACVKKVLDTLAEMK